MSQSVTSVTRQRQEATVSAPVYISFDAPGQVPVIPRGLHVILSAVLDLPSGVSPERTVQSPTLAYCPAHGSDEVKPYLLGELNRPESTFGVEVHFLGDRLVDALDAWLSQGSVMHLGAGTNDDAMLVAVKRQVIVQESWEELVEQDGGTMWEVRLVTPTTFSSKGRYVPGLNPATIATNLQQRWQTWNRRLVPPRINRHEMASVLAIQDCTCSSMMSLAMPYNSGQGRLSSRRIPVHKGHLHISGAEGAEVTRVFSRLMALSVYTDVDSHTNYGMGVVDAVAA